MALCLPSIRCIMLAILVVSAFIEPINGQNETHEDSCYEERNGIYPCSSTITGNLLLMCFYGALLGVAAKLISDGAEMLLDFGFSPSIIGGVVLPILGAVPDSAIIVASGMGENAQEKLSVGMGTLAGSTVMLLTVAWAASVGFAKCDLNKKGESKDQCDKEKFSFTKKGITILPEIKSGIFIMLATSLLYLVVQSADWYWGATKKVGQPKYVRDAALATMIMCIIGLVFYIVFSIFDTKRTDRIARLHKEEIVKRHVLHAMLLLADRQSFKPAKSPELTGTSAEDVDDHEENKEAVSKKYFKAWHMKKGTKDIREKLNLSDADEQTPLVDDNGDVIDTKLDVKEIIEEEEKEEEENKCYLAIKCIVMLVGGVGIVTIFADPMCDVLTALTDSKNKSYIPIPTFYVSFVVTPFCSNASELVSSLIFAAKKRRENATMTFAQLFGAATMNNTMCLAIFMGLVYFKDLEWIYGAEVVCILVVQWVVGLISLTKTYKVWMGIPVAVTYIICLMIVYLLENEAGWF